MQKYLNQIINIDYLKEMRKLPNEIVNYYITSPPYWKLRDYGVQEQLDLEKTPEEYVAKVVNVNDVLIDLKGV